MVESYGLAVGCVKQLSGSKPAEGVGLGSCDANPHLMSLQSCGSRRSSTGFSSLGPHNGSMAAPG